MNICRQFSNTVELCMQTVACLTPESMLPICFFLNILWLGCSVNHQVLCKSVRENLTLAIPKLEKNYQTYIQAFSLYCVNCVPAYFTSMFPSLPLSSLKKQKQPWGWISDHLLGNHWTEGNKLKESRLLEMAFVALCKPFWAAQSSAEMQKSVVTD